MLSAWNDAGMKRPSAGDAARGIPKAVTAMVGHQGSIQLKVQLECLMACQAAKYHRVRGGGWCGGSERRLSVSDVSAATAMTRSTLQTFGDDGMTLPEQPWRRSTRVAAHTAAAPPAAISAAAAAAAGAACGGGNGSGDRSRTGGEWKSDSANRIHGRKFGNGFNTNSGMMILPGRPDLLSPAAWCELAVTLAEGRIQQQQQQKYLQQQPPFHPGQRSSDVITDMDTSPGSGSLDAKETGGRSGRPSEAPRTLAPATLPEAPPATATALAAQVPTLVGADSSNGGSAWLQAFMEGTAGGGRGSIVSQGGGGGCSRGGRSHGTKEPSLEQLARVLWALQVLYPRGEWRGTGTGAGTGTCSTTTTTAATTHVAICPAPPSAANAAVAATAAAAAAAVAKAAATPNTCARGVSSVNTAVGQSFVEKRPPYQYQYRQEQEPLAAGQRQGRRQGQQQQQQAECWMWWWWHATSRAVRQALECGWMHDAETLVLLLDGLKPLVSEEMVKMAPQPLPPLRPPAFWRSSVSAAVERRLLTDAAMSDIGGALCIDAVAVASETADALDGGGCGRAASRARATAVAAEGKSEILHREAPSLAEGVRRTATHRNRGDVVPELRRLRNCVSLLRGYTELGLHKGRSASVRGLAPAVLQYALRASKNGVGADGPTAMALPDEDLAALMRFHQLYGSPLTNAAELVQLLIDQPGLQTQTHTQTQTETQTQTPTSKPTSAGILPLPLLADVMAGLSTATRPLPSHLATRLAAWTVAHLDHHFGSSSNNCNSVSSCGASDSSSTKSVCCSGGSGSSSSSDSGGAIWMASSGEEAPTFTDPRVAAQKGLGAGSAGSEGSVRSIGLNVGAAVAPPPPPVSGSSVSAAAAAAVEVHSSTLPNHLSKGSTAPHPPPPHQLLLQQPVRPRPLQPQLQLQQERPQSLEVAALQSDCQALENRHQQPHQQHQQAKEHQEQQHQQQQDTLHILLDLFVCVARLAARHTRRGGGGSGSGTSTSPASAAVAAVAAAGCGERAVAAAEATEYGEEEEGEEEAATAGSAGNEVEVEVQSTAMPNSTFEAVLDAFLPHLRIRLGASGSASELQKAARQLMAARRLFQRERESSHSATSAATAAATVAAAWCALEAAWEPSLESAGCGLVAPGPLLQLFVDLSFTSPNMMSPAFLSQVLHSITTEVDRTAFLLAMLPPAEGQREGTGVGQEQRLKERSRPHAQSKIDLRPGRRLGVPSVAAAPSSAAASCLSADEVSYAAAAMARLMSGQRFVPSGIVRRLAAGVLAAAPRMSPAALSQGVWALAELGATAPHVIGAEGAERLLAVLGDRLATFPSQSLPLLLWSLARIRLRPVSRWMVSYTRLVKAHVRQYDMRQVAQLAWAYGQLTPAAPYSKLYHRPPRDLVRRLLRKSFHAMRISDSRGGGGGDCWKARWPNKSSLLPLQPSPPPLHHHHHQQQQQQQQQQQRQPQHQRQWKRGGATPQASAGTSTSAAATATATGTAGTAAVAVPGAGDSSSAPPQRCGGLGVPYHYSRLRPGDLALLVFGLASLEAHPGGAWLRRLYSWSGPHLASFTAGELGMLLFGLAGVGAQPPTSWVCRAARCFSVQLPYSSGLDAAHAAAGLARLAPVNVPESVVAAFAEAIPRILRRGAWRNTGNATGGVVSSGAATGGDSSDRVSRPVERRVDREGMEGPREAWATFLRSAFVQLRYNVRPPMARPVVATTTGRRMSGGTRPGTAEVSLLGDGARASPCSRTPPAASEGWGNTTAAAAAAAAAAAESVVNPIGFFHQSTDSDDMGSRAPRGSDARRRLVRLSVTRDNRRPRLRWHWLRPAAPPSVQQQQQQQQ